jgi:hypothetical protein
MLPASFGRNRNFIGVIEMPIKSSSRCEVSIPLDITGQDSVICGSYATFICENCGPICNSCAETFPCPLISDEKHIPVEPHTPTPKPRKPVLTPIVIRALTETVTDIGQLSRIELRELAYAVKYGVLAKGKGGPYPILKMVYAPSGFDFVVDRESQIADLRRAHMRDLARGTAKFFPWVAFQKLDGVA